MDHLDLERKRLAKVHKELQVQLERYCELVATCRSLVDEGDLLTKVEWGNAVRLISDTKERIISSSNLSPTLS